MRIQLDLNTIDGYRTFLKVKSLPVYRFVGREAVFPDEYAGRVCGINPQHIDSAAYTPTHGLFDYQRDIAAIAIRKRKYAVFMEPGMGKTLIDFEFAHHATEATGKRTLIVAPLMVVRQMIEEHIRFYPSLVAPEHIRAAGLQEWLNRSGPGFGLTNYEAIRDGLTQGNLGCLILSESSMLKSHYGKWGQRLIDLGRGIDWKLCETGTPAPNDRIEYANHSVFLDHYPTINSFLARFFINRGETQNRWELKTHALRPFYKALSHWCIFMSNPATYGWKDNTEPLPPIRVHMPEIALTDGQRHDAMNATGNLFGVPGGIGERGEVARIAKRADGNKPQFIADLVNKSKDSCIVWCKYNPEQDELARLLPKCADVSGATPEEKRIELIHEFLAGKRKTLLSKPKIMGFGLNLQIANRMVFSTLQDSYEDYFQCVKRANRYGSTKLLDVFIPATDLERPMIDTVLRKADQIQSDTREQEQLFKEVGYGQ